MFPGDSQLFTMLFSDFWLHFQPIEYVAYASCDVVLRPVNTDTLLCSIVFEANVEKEHLHHRWSSDKWNSFCHRYSNIPANCFRMIEASIIIRLKTSYLCPNDRKALWFPFSVVVYSIEIGLKTTGHRCLLRWE